MANDNSSELRRIEALVHYYLHLDPDTLSDDKLAQVWGRLRLALEITGQVNKS